jgi:hypothetical protein
MLLLKNDYEIKNISDESELDDAISFRLQHDRIFKSKIRDLSLARVNEGESSSDFIKRVNAAMPESIVKDNSNGLFLEFWTEVNGTMKRAVAPIRYTALDSIYERARVNCFTISNTDESGDAQAMDMDEKIKFINKAFKLYSGYAQILFRDEKITSVMSNQYYHITMDSLNKGILALKEDFPDMKFKKAELSHEFFKETYDLQSDELQEDILLNLKEGGVDAENVSIVVNAHTCDHGKIAATFYGQIIVDDIKLLFGSPVSVKHSGKKNDEHIQKAAKELYSSFKNNLDKIKALPSISIDNPDGCLRMIAKEYRLPKKIACELADTLVGKTGVTAYEIYWMLNKIVLLAEERGLEPLRIMVLQDMVARTLNTNYKKFDKVFMWTRGESEE